MIATIAVIAEKKLSDRSDNSDHMETTLQRSQRSQRQRSLRYKECYLSDRCRYDRWTFLFSAIVAIIWKPGLIYRNNYPPFLLNCYLYALQIYRKHSPKLWLLLVSWLNSHQKIISIQTPQRDPVHKIYKVFLQIDQKYTHLSGWYLWLQKGHTSVDVYSHFKLE